MTRLAALVKIQFESLNKKLFLFGSSKKQAEPKPDYIKRWYILMPDDKLKIFWNMVVLFLLSYTATIVPYRTASFWFVFDVCVDVLFLIDLFVNMFSAVEKGDNKYETRICYILLHYMRTWFFLDLIAVIPFQYFISNNESSGAGGSVYHKLLRLA